MTPAEKYIESITNCEIDLEGYPFSFTKVLKELSDEIYPTYSHNSLPRI